MRFSDQPNPSPLESFPEKIQPRFPLIRTPNGGKRASFIILTDKPLMYPTHWVRSRTTPCLAPENCEGCNAEVEIRYKLYVAVYFPSDAQIAVLETTDHGGQTIFAHWQKYGSVRGRKLTVWRSGKKDNSPCNSSISPQPLDITALPESPDVRAYLNRMWFSRPNPPTSEPHTSSPELPGQIPLHTADGQPLSNGRSKSRISKGK